jgi:formylglycine-generating enzyme required for sulfatase activity
MKNYKNLFILFLLILCSCSNTQQSEILKVPVENTFIEFINVKGGKFTMGCNDGFVNKMLYSVNDCNCSHKVIDTTVSTFYISKYPITYSQFKLFQKETSYQTTADIQGGVSLSCIAKTEYKKVLPLDIPYSVEESESDIEGLWICSIFAKGINWQYSPKLSKRNENDNKYPVTFVSIQDVMVFCEWLSKKTGYTIHLPTNVEWEFAARGGNYSKGYCRAGTNRKHDFKEEYDTTYRYTIPMVKEVDYGIPNELGIYGMTYIGEFTEPNLNQNELTIRGSTVWSQSHLLYDGVLKSDGGLDSSIGFRVAFSPK